MKGWLKLLLDKVLRAVSSLVQTLTLGSISAAFEQECPQKSDGRRLAPQIHGAKTCPTAGEKEFFPEGKRDLPIVPGSVCELIFIPRVTLVQHKCETRAEGVQKLEKNTGTEATGGFITSSSRPWWT